MDGIVGTVKNLVYRRVLLGDVVINTPKEFANFADQITSVDCLFLEYTELLKEPEEVTNAPPIPSTLKIHKVQRVANGPNSFSNLFFKLSEDIEPFYTETYGIQCGHRVNNIDDESLCNNCYKMYVRGEGVVKVSRVLPVVSRRLFLCLIKSFQFYCKVLSEIHQRCFEVFDLVRLFIYISREGLLNLLNGISILKILTSTVHNRMNISSE